MNTLTIHAAYELNGRAATARASDIAAAEFEAVYCEQFEATEATANEAVKEAAALIRAAQKLAPELAHASHAILISELADIEGMNKAANILARRRHASQVALEAFLDSLLEGCEPEQRKAIETLFSAAFTEAL